MFHFAENHTPAALLPIPAPEVKVPKLEKGQADSIILIRECNLLCLYYAACCTQSGSTYASNTDPGLRLRHICHSLYGVTVVISLSKYTVPCCFQLGVL